MNLLNARKKLVTMAVASAISGGVMMSAPAHAMNVSQNNVGEVLLYPYYTVKNGFDTVFTVTNTSDRTAVFKIRFREALNSREVRDFNVILSPYDHWGAAVTRDAAGTGAVVRTYDKTCTSPILPASATAAGATEVAFTNALFSGNFTDGASQAIDRVQEGYFEVILMGVSTRSTSVSSNTVEYNAKHVNGVPRNCATVDAQFNDVAANLSPYFIAPENILKGHVTYIDVTTGKAVDAEPTHIEDFRSGDDIIAAPGDLVPDLSSGDAVGTVNRIANGVNVADLYTTGSEDGVSAVLMADSVINEYATGSGAATSWVVTFPTKHHYTDSYTAFTGPTLEDGTPGDPFSEWFYNSSTDGKSCDTISMVLFNREEGTVTPSGTQFSPVPASGSVELCYEANIINFNSSNVFGSGTNRLAVDTTAVGTAGWAALTFTDSANDGLDAGGVNTWAGLPVIGFAAIMRDAGGATVNYGSSEEHSYTVGTVVTP